jgi:hypothetical protein
VARKGVGTVGSQLSLVSREPKGERVQQSPIANQQ